MATQITMADFKVDLGIMSDAISTLQGAHAQMEPLVKQIEAKCAEVTTDWRSPAGGTWVFVTGELGTAMDKLVKLLADSIAAMQKTHQNYVAMETENVQISS